jgi:hypothetical protein
VDFFTTHSDAIWTLAALVPLAIAVASWALQMASGFCSVDPPEFWHAVTTVVIIAVINSVLRLALNAADASQGIVPQYVAPILVTGAVITLSIPTGPFTAVTIAVVQLILCAAIFYTLLWLHETVSASVMML